MPNKPINKISEEMFKDSEFDQLKPITAIRLFKTGACLDELEKFIKKYGRFGKIEDYKEFIEFAKKQKGWIEFLIDRKFIAMKYTTFKVGEVIEIKFSENRVLYGMICQIQPWTYTIINISTGNRIKDPPLKICRSSLLTKEDILKLLPINSRIKKTDFVLMAGNNVYIQASPITEVRKEK